MSCTDKQVAKWIKTGVVLLAMMDAGINIGLFSPTFPSMQVVTSSTTTEISTTLTWVGVTSAVGAVLSGPVFDRFDGYAVLAAALLAQGVAIGLAPWCRVLIGYQVMSAIACAFNFAIMSGTLLVNCNLWLDSPHLIGPIVQTTDLVHALGAAIAPQIIAPFLRQQQHNATADLLTESSYSYATSTSPGGHTFLYENGPKTRPAMAITNSTQTPGVQPVQAAYVLIAAIDVIVAVFCVVTCLIDRCCARSRDTTYDAYSSTEVVEPTTDVTTESLEARPSPRRNSVIDDALPVSDMRAAALAARRRAGTEREKSRSRHYSEEAQLSKHPRERSWTLAAVDSSLYVRNHPDALSLIVTIGRNDAVPPDHDNHPEPSSSSNFSSPAIAAGFGWRSAFVLAAILMYFAVNGARDAVLTGLLYTYVVEYAGWSTRGATLLVTGYHVTRVVVHVVVVLVARWVTSFKLSVINVVVLLVSSVFLVATVHSVGHGYFAAGIILTGFATSNVHATAITLARESFEVSGKMMGLFIGSIAFGQCVVSPVAGVLMQDVGALSFPVILLSLSALSAVFLLAWTLFHKFLITRRQPETISSSVDDVTEKTKLLHH